MGADYIAAFGPVLLAGTQRHLRELYDGLLGPVADRLRARHLVIVPQGVLHAVPFQALFDGKKYLIDRFTVSYAPSATIYHLCQTRQANTRGPALVLGVPDAAAPVILDEARTVAAVLQNSELYLEEKATFEILRTRGPHSRLIHIATHGHFRRDNPMFSG